MSGFDRSSFFGGGWNAIPRGGHGACRVGFVTPTGLARLVGSALGVGVGKGRCREGSGQRRGFGNQGRGRTNLVVVAVVVFRRHPSGRGWGWVTPPASPREQTLAAVVESLDVEATAQAIGERRQALEPKLAISAHLPVGAPGLYRTRGDPRRRCAGRVTGYSLPWQPRCHPPGCRWINQQLFKKSPNTIAGSAAGA